MPTLEFKGKQHIYAHHLGSCLEIIENCGHHPEPEAMERFVRLVEDFLG